MESKKEEDTYNKEEEDEEEMDFRCEKCGNPQYLYDILVSKETWLKWMSKDCITTCKCA